MKPNPIRATKYNPLVTGSACRCSITFYCRNGCVLPVHEAKIASLRTGLVNSKTCLLKNPIWILTIIPHVIMARCGSGCWRFFVRRIRSGNPGLAPDFGDFWTSFSTVAIYHSFFFSRRSVLKIFTARSSTHKPFILKTKTCRRCSVAKYTSSSSLKLAFCSICPFIDRVGPRLPGNKYDLTKIIAHKLQAHKPIIIIIALDSYKNDKRPEN